MALGTNTPTVLSGLLSGQSRHPLPELSDVVDWRRLVERLAMGIQGFSNEPVQRRVSMLVEKIT
jgi:hypothetical protein